MVSGPFHVGERRAHAIGVNTFRGHANSASIGDAFGIVLYVARVVLVREQDADASRSVDPKVNVARECCGGVVGGLGVGWGGDRNVLALADRSSFIS